MTTSVGNVIVELRQSRQQGDVWTVRLYRKFLVFRKLISSDWFLDEAQAQNFANRLSEELRNGLSAERVAGRKPGWKFV